MQKTCAVAAAAVLFSLLGCHGGGGSGASSYVGGSTRSSVGSQSGIVGPAGGSVVNAQGDGVDIPAGDLATATAISIGAGTEVGLPGYVSVGAPVELTPDGTPFTTPATVTVRFDASKIPSGHVPQDIVIIRREQSGVTTPLAWSSIDPLATKVSALTDSFCTFEPEVSVAAVMLKVTTSSLPPGTVGVAYSAGLAASGGTTPYSWALVAGGPLPAGLSLDPSTGAISGMPSAPAAATPVFEVTDSAGAKARVLLSISIQPAGGGLQVTTWSLPSGTVGVAYSAGLAASGGATPYSWAVAAGGPLPAGLSLNSAAGTISGVPTLATTAWPDFEVTDATGAKARSGPLPLTISGPSIQVTMTVLPTGTAGVPYSATLTTSGGTPPFTWGLYSGALPGGISLDPAKGRLSGTPARAVTTTLVFSVYDSAGSTAQSGALTLTILPLAGAVAPGTTFSWPGATLVFSEVFSSAPAASAWTSPHTAGTGDPAWSSAEGNPAPSESFARSSDLQTVPTFSLPSAPSSTTAFSADLGFPALHSGEGVTAAFTLTDGTNRNQVTFLIQAQEGGGATHATYEAVITGGGASPDDTGTQSYNAGGQFHSFVVKVDSQGATECLLDGASVLKGTTGNELGAAPYTLILSGASTSGTTAVLFDNVQVLNHKDGAAAPAITPTRSDRAATFAGMPYTVGPVVAPGVTGAEQHIAADPRNPSNLVAAIDVNRVASSLDVNGGGAGASWQPSTLPSGVFGDSVVAIDLSGNVFVVQNNGTGGFDGISVSLAQLPSSPGALSFTSVTMVAWPTGSGEDKPWIAVDNTSSPFSGNVYTAWTHSSQTIEFSRSTDHGRTWSSAIDVMQLPEFGAQIGIGPAGEVYLVIGGYFNGLLMMAKSLDGGVTFSAPAPISPSFAVFHSLGGYRTASIPALAVDGRSGAIYVLYSDTDGNNGAELELTRSTDGGATFSQPVVINDDSTGDQFMPAIAVDEAGTIHASWFDTRVNGVPDSYDIYATRSLDGGVTWAPNARVTPASISASSFFIGDYSGIAAGGGMAHPVWTDGQLETATLR